MTTTAFLIGCTHFGHTKMCEFVRFNGEKVRPFTNSQEMDETLVSNWNGVVTTTDKVYVLGDVAFSRSNLATMERLNGKKILIKGNHDNLDLKDYVKYFYDIRASHKLDNSVLTHIPIHPDSLGCQFEEESGLWKSRWSNIHAHLHAEAVMKNGVEDNRYFSVCVERINYTPISFDEVKKRIKEREQEAQ